MRRQDRALLALIVVLAIAAIWIDWPTNPGLHIKLGPIKIDREIKIRQGLDLQGGLQVLLEADLPPGQSVDAEAMNAAKGIVENRVNALGVVEPLIQLQGGNRIIVELPGIEDPDLAIRTIGRTGLLEFVDAGNTPLEPGTLVSTSLEVSGTVWMPPSVVTPTPTLEVTPTATAVVSPSLTATPEISPAATLTPEATPAKPSPKVYTTVLTGRLLKSADVGFDRLGKPIIRFSLGRKGDKPEDDGPRIFAEFTSRNVGRYLAIVLDRRVVSCPIIKNAITDGEGIIEGNFTLEEAKNIVVVLRYGMLPVPLKVLQTRNVGPTLGQDSVRRSIRAGLVGLSVVLLFMLVYYRLPGALADIALILYALLNLAIYKFGIPGLFSGVTLTLPGITGFILSTGMAVDANILIFERMKEELRWGKSLGAAIEAGFSRAWTSIRDSNLSTLITCAILFWFGSNFGASMVKGFAVTLFIGVCISMFTAITVTRTLIRLAFELAGDWIQKRRWLLGV